MIPTEEPRPRAVPLPWSPFQPTALKTELLPIPAPVQSAPYLDVLKQRRSRVGGPIFWDKVADILWHTVRCQEIGPVGRAGIPIEWRPVPSAGGLHPIHIVCIPEDARDGIRLYDPYEHAFIYLDVNAEKVVASQREALEQMVGKAVGCTLLLIADMEKVNAAYEHGETLVWRDAGCIIGSLCLTATALSSSACPLGFLGTTQAILSGFTSPPCKAVAGLLLTQ